MTTITKQIEAASKAAKDHHAAITTAQELVAELKPALEKASLALEHLATTWSLAAARSADLIVTLGALELPADPDDDDDQPPPEFEVPETVPTTPATPIEPSIDDLEALEPLEVNRTVVVHQDMTEQDVSGALGRVGPGTRVLVRGQVPRMRLGGGGHGNQIIRGLPGRPLEHVEFTHEPGSGFEAVIHGVDLFPDKHDSGGVGAGVRFRGVAIEPIRDGDDIPTGSKAPVQTIGTLNDLHLVLDDVDLRAPEHWTGYGGFGMKWACVTHGARVTGRDVSCAPALEHSFYPHNTRDGVVLISSRNRVRWMLGDDGITRPLGNGRTFAQHANRFTEGDPSGGLIKLIDCVAERTGWQEILDHIDAEGNIAPDHYGNGGGAAFTCHGHTGPAFILEGCHAEEPYCGVVAIWNEPGKDVPKTEVNPRGIRAWQCAGDDGVINPATHQSWGTRRARVTGLTWSRRGTRPPVQISSVAQLELDPGYMLDPYTWQLNHQAGVRAIGEVLTIEAP